MPQELLAGGKEMSQRASTIEPQRDSNPQPADLEHAEFMTRSTLLGIVPCGYEDADAGRQGNVYGIFRGQV
jgi:hypothetical protein